MSTLCKTYSDEARPARPCDGLRGRGNATAMHSTADGLAAARCPRGAVGTFAGSVGPDAPVGTFAGRPRRRRQGTGAYAGDPDRQRKGCFGDVDRDVIVTFGGGAEHPRVATHRMLRRLLRAVTLDGEPADRLVDELHVGHGLVLADQPPLRISRREV